MTNPSQGMCTHSIADDHGLAGTIDPLSGNAVLFATSFDSAGANRTKLFRLIDNGTSSGFTSSLTLLATAPDNGGFATAFRGVEIVPLPVPEPGSITLLGVAGVSFLRRRKSA